MIRCKIIGKIWATKKRPELEAYSLMLLEPLNQKNPALNQNLLVAANAIHAKTGEQVLVSFGSGARNAIGNQNLPIDAAIVGIIDPEVDK